MNFEPPLSYSKKTALDSLFYFGSVKIFLKVRNIFKFLNYFLWKFLKFSRAFWSESNRLPIIPYNSSTEQNGASAVSDDIIRTVRIFIL